MNATLAMPANEALAGASAIPARLVGAVKRYGAVTALDGVDIEIRRGELLALLGPNGAGKTTAVSLWLGLLRPDAGRAELFGIDPQRSGARLRLGVMLQEAALQGSLKVDELIRLTSSYYPNPRDLGEVARLAGVEDLLKRRYAKLSGGQKRRVQFALAICGSPEVLFLDEPTVGLDVAARSAMWATLRELVVGGCAIVLTTHYLEEAEALATRVVVLSHGRVVAQGSVDEIRAHIAQRRIRCVTSLTVETLQNWPCVDGVQREGERLVLVTTEAEAVLAWLLAEDPGLRELEVQRAGLAEAFVEITRDETGTKEAT